MKIEELKRIGWTMEGDSKKELSNIKRRYKRIINSRGIENNKQAIVAYEIAESLFQFISKFEDDRMR